MKKRFSEEQIIGMLREGEADGVVIRDVGASTILRSRHFSGGAEVWRHNGIDARRLKDLESENAKLKKIVAEQM